MTDPRRLLTVLKDVNVESIGEDEKLRVQFINVTRALYQRLENPWDSILPMLFAETTLLLTTKITLDLDVFQALVDSAPKTPSDLAKRLYLQPRPNLLGRLLRQLASASLVDIVGPDTGGGGVSHRKAHGKCEVASPAISLFQSFLFRVRERF